MQPARPAAFRRQADDLNDRSWTICVVGRHKLAETSPCSSIHQIHNLATPSKPRFAYRYPPATNSESCVPSANEIKAPSSEYWLCHDSDGPHCWHIKPSISRWVGWRFDRQARLSRNQGRPVATVLVRSTAQRHPKKEAWTGRTGRSEAAGPAIRFSERCRRSIVRISVPPYA